MQIRDLNLNDLVLLEGSLKDFQMPRVSNPLYIENVAIVDENGETIGMAFLHLTTEVSIIFEKKCSKFKRAKGLMTLFHVLRRMLIHHKLEDTHVFLLGDEDGAHEKFLEKRLGFVKATGTPMYYQVGRKEDG